MNILMKLGIFVIYQISIPLIGAKLFKLEKVSNKVIAFLWSLSVGVFFLLIIILFAQDLFWIGVGFLVFSMIIGFPSTLWFLKKIR